MNRRDELIDAIALLEAQRATLGDTAVDASIAAMRQALSAHDQAARAEQRKTAIPYSATRNRGRRSKWVVGN